MDGGGSVGRTGLVDNHGTARNNLGREGVDLDESP